MNRHITTFFKQNLILWIYRLPQPVLAMFYDMSLGSHEPEILVFSNIELVLNTKNIHYYRIGVSWYILMFSKFQDMGFLQSSLLSVSLKTNKLGMVCEQLLVWGVQWVQKYENNRLVLEEAQDKLVYIGTVRRWKFRFYHNTTCV